MITAGHKNGYLKLMIFFCSSMCGKMQESGFIKILPDLCIQLSKGLFFQSRVPLPIFHPQFLSGCTAVADNFIFVELGSEQTLCSSLFTHECV